METIEKLTVRCFVLGIAFVLVWFLCCVTGDWMYEIHLYWFKLSQHEFAVINYAGLMFAKACVVVFFLVPYIASKWAKKG